MTDPIQDRYSQIVDLLNNNGIPNDGVTMNALAIILTQSSVEARIKKQEFMSTMKDIWRRTVTLRDAQVAGMVLDEVVEGPTEESKDAGKYSL